MKCWQMVRFPYDPIAHILIPFIALQYAKEHSCHESGDCEISVTQLQWFYQASYRMGVQLAHYQNVEATLQALRYSHEVCITPSPSIHV